MLYYTIKFNFSTHLFCVHIIILATFLGLLIEYILHVQYPITRPSYYPIIKTYTYYLYLFKLVKLPFNTLKN